FFRSECDHISIGMPRQVRGPHSQIGEFSRGATANRCDRNFGGWSQTRIRSGKLLAVLLETHPIELLSFEALHVAFLKITGIGDCRNCSWLVLRFNDPLSVETDDGAGGSRQSLDRRGIWRIDRYFPQSALSTAASSLRFERLAHADAAEENRAVHARV